MFEVPCVLSGIFRKKKKRGGGEMERDCPQECDLGQNHLILSTDSVLCEKELGSFYSDQIRL